MKLARNVGTVDRIARFVIGILLAIAVLGGAATGLLAIVALVGAGIMFATGALGTCPIYSLLGVRTCPLQRSQP